MGAYFNQCLNLLKIAKDQGLYQNLVIQIRKDFEMANVPIQLSKEDSLKIPECEGLIKSLHEKVYFLIMERFSDYLNLLYIVDIPESTFKDIPITDAVEFSEQVVFLVLQRDWQKVLLKKKYTS